MLTEENKNPIEDLIESGNEDANPEMASSNSANLPDNSNSDELEKLKAELIDQKDKFLRLYAEFDNFKRRTSKERIDLIKTAGQDIIVELLGILDDFERAQRMSVETENKNLYPEGMELIYNKFFSLLTHKGLKALDSTGTDFNPELHEAIAEIPASSDSLKSKVIDTTEKGYYLGDKIIRFAKVVVGK
ncbi:MAG: nucleotide exchange factor GrpE [Saprospiraceae bacterium]|nr:nucleotide exchange factor GrpE [Saprospiraceae bacterium]